ncbi:MAG: hypothetical protein QOE65_1706 [Solirubrobacteraceae bacterium]|jgi:hypothetical protein|nr:hypothetical protein [Solirubrobacteraceae bacterium]
MQSALSDQTPGLADRLRDAHGKDRRLDPADFYASWFRAPTSSSYFFLFKKNLTVTNLQFAELVALLRTHTSFRDGREPRPSLHFVSTSDFKDKTRRLLTALGGRSKKSTQDDVWARCNLFEELWGDLYERTVALDAFYGSCVAFFPPALSLDLRAVCAESGYIHSCGPSVWVRKVRKARNGEELLKGVRSHIGSDPAKRTFFAVYSHEDFTGFDREQASELRHGLDDVKVWVEKYWIGGDRLVSVLQRIDREMGEDVEVAGAGDYRISRKAVEADPNIDPTRSLWLLVDRGVHPSGRRPTSERYYICYEQLWKNENPFHGFDENKPAWRAHTTLPHTLTAAMLNITRPYQPPGAVQHLMDPFVGSGTTLLEAAKYPNIRPAGADIDPLAPRLIGDNFAFFCMSAEQLDAIHQHLKHVVVFLEGEERPELRNARQALVDETERRRLLSDTAANRHAKETYTWAEGLVAGIAGNPSAELTLDDRQLGDLEARDDFVERLYFYIALRAVRRSVGARQSDASRSYRAAWISEARVLLRQIEHLAGRTRQVTRGDDGQWRWFHGAYSNECAISPALLAAAAEKAKTGVEVLDALESNRSEAVDLYITDPPYGFNTDDDPHTLAQLYRHIVQHAFEALRDGGQLVLALPDQSFVGREPAFFAHRNFVQQLIASVSHETGRELLGSAEVLPSEPDVYKAPYYWESDRALRRAVLHYRVGRTGVGVRNASNPAGE